LYFAALSGTDDTSLELFKLLILYGGNYRFKDHNGQTVLFYVCREGSDCIM
jgi:ankyrin repeat protein